MELKVKIGYSELFELILQLPTNQISRLKEDLSRVNFEKFESKNNKKLKTLLLNGPTMSEEQFRDYESTRKLINQWRTAN